MALSGQRSTLILAFLGCVRKKYDELSSYDAFDLLIVNTLFFFSV